MVIPDEYNVVFEAIDPTTGAPVTGVQVDNIAIFGENVGGGVSERKVPLLTPEEVDGLN
jgi:hypothetical protein